MLTRTYLRNLSLEQIERSNNIIKKTVETALYNIKISAIKRHTKYRIDTSLYSSNEIIHAGVLESLRSHLPDSTITVDVLGNGIVIKWA